MGKNKLVPFKDVSFSNNYGYIALKNENCENKCSVVSDFWLERTVSFKELVILWDFVGEEYVKLNSKEKEEVMK